VDVAEFLSELYSELEQIEHQIRFVERFDGLNETSVGPVITRPARRRQPARRATDQERPQPVN